MVNNKWLLLAFVVLAVYLLPNIFFPNDAHFLIHPGLSKEFYTNNKLLHSVVYQHYTNCIENYFSILKNYLYKKKDLGYIKLNENIKSIIKEIPLSIYENIFKGSYERTK